MNFTTPPSLCHQVQVFFNDYLTLQRNVSSNTILSYRDALKLFLSFAAQQCEKSVVDLSFEDLGPEIVLSFLNDLEKNRNNSVRTRNARLAALHTFFRYVAAHEPQVLGLCQQISAIPIKKSVSTHVVYLEFDEIKHIICSIDCSTPLGRRDNLLIHLLFESGARAQEIASLRTHSLRFSKPYQVRILGKGQKERICPLRSNTVKLIQQNLKERNLDVSQDAALFVGIRGEPLTRHGILRIVQRRVQHAAKTMPSLLYKRIGAHTFRHAAAIHLLRAGNDLSVIRSWLGHVSVTTTDQYTCIDLEMKRKALEESEPMPSRQKPSWRKEPNLLDWLESL